jgi:hypothetical protein
MKKQPEKHESTEQAMKKAQQERDIEQESGYGDKKLEGPNYPAT